MPSDKTIITHHETQGDRVGEPRPVTHRFHFKSMGAAHNFADDARRAGFPTGASQSTGDTYYLAVDRLQPLTNADGEPHEDFATIASLGERHGADRLDWVSPVVKPRPADAIVKIVRRFLDRRRIRGL